jgi:D-sedoheptulose 7-phosphate isomerase
MPMLEQRVQQQFFESADLLNESSLSLSRPVAQAAQSLVTAFSAGNKLLVASSRPGFATMAAALFCGRLERERPPLAAFALGDGATAADQVLALAQAGDVLLVQDSGGTADAGLLACAAAARQREMSLVVLTQARAEAWASATGSVLQDGDVLLPVAHERALRVAEVHHMVVHALCDAVDAQLFGETSA